jgi:protein phosphatase
MAFRVFSFGCTDIGMKRQQNQDRYRIDADLNLYMVADGMGGHRGGEVASRMAVDTVEEHLRAHRAALTRGAEGSPPADRPAARLVAEGVRRACRAIYERSASDPELDKMGTTATALLLLDGWAFLAHVGDSRCYLLRDDRIRLLSDDHSIVAEQVRAGLITEEEAMRSPYRNVITRSVGVERDVVVDMLAVEARSADAFLICSDGLTGLVRDEEIKAVVDDNFLHRVPERLVDLANERGGPDNITVVLAYLIDERELPRAPARRAS